MRKILSLLIIAMFVVSLSPAVFAVNDNAGGQGNGNSAGNDATPTLYQDRAQGPMDGAKQARAEHANEKMAKARERFQTAKEKFQKNKEQLRERMAKVKEKRAEAKAKHTEAKGRIEGRKAKLTACVGDESEDCNALRKETRKYTKDYLSGVAEHVLGMIAKTKERVENSNMPEDQKTEMLANLEAKAEEIAGALETAEGLTEESSKEDFQEVAKIIRESWTGTKDEIKNGAGKVAANKIRALNTRMGQLQTKLERTLERLQNAGEDTTTAQRQLDAYKENLDKSKTAEQEAQAKYQESDTAGAVEKTKEAHRYLIEAQKNLKQLVQTIKKAQGGEEALKARNQNREQSGQDVEDIEEAEETGEATESNETKDVDTAPEAVFPDTNVTE